MGVFLLFSLLFASVAQATWECTFAGDQCSGTPMYCERLRSKGSVPDYCTCSSTTNTSLGYFSTALPLAGALSVDYGCRGSATLALGYQAISCLPAFGLYFKKSVSSNVSECAVEICFNSNCTLCSTVDSSSGCISTSTTSTTIGLSVSCSPTTANKTFAYFPTFAPEPCVEPGWPLDCYWDDLDCSGAPAFCTSTADEPFGAPLPTPSQRICRVCNSTQRSFQQTGTTTAVPTSGTWELPGTVKCGFNQFYGPGCHRDFLNPNGGYISTELSTCSVARCSDSNCTSCFPLRCSTSCSSSPATYLPSTSTTFECPTARIACYTAESDCTKALMCTDVAPGLNIPPQCACAETGDIRATFSVPKPTKAMCGLAFSPCNATNRQARVYTDGCWQQDSLQVTGWPLTWASPWSPSYYQEDYIYVNTTSCEFGIYCDSSCSNCRTRLPADVCEDDWKITCVRSDCTPLPSIAPRAPQCVDAISVPAIGYERRCLTPFNRNEGCNSTDLCVWRPLIVPGRPAAAPLCECIYSTRAHYSITTEVPMGRMIAFSIDSDAMTFEREGCFSELGLYYSGSLYVNFTSCSIKQCNAGCETCADAFSYYIPTSCQPSSTPLTLPPAAPSSLSDLCTGETYYRCTYRGEDCSELISCSLTNNKQNLQLGVCSCLDGYSTRILPYSTQYCGAVIDNTLLPVGVCSATGPSTYRLVSPDCRYSPNCDTRTSLNESISCNFNASCVNVTLPRSALPVCSNLQWQYSCTFENSNCTGAVQTCQLRRGPTTCDCAGSVFEHILGDPFLDPDLFCGVTVSLAPTVGMGRPSFTNYFEGCSQVQGAWYWANASECSLLTCDADCINCTPLIPVYPAWSVTCSTKACATPAAGNTCPRAVGYSCELADPNSCSKSPSQFVRCTVGGCTDSRSYCASGINRNCIDNELPHCGISVLTYPDDQCALTESTKQVVNGCVRGLDQVAFYDSVGCRIFSDCDPSCGVCGNVISLQNQSCLVGSKFTCYAPCGEPFELPQLLVPLKPSPTPSPTPTYTNTDANTHTKCYSDGDSDCDSDCDSNHYSNSESACPCSTRGYDVFFYFHN